MGQQEDHKRGRAPDEQQLERLLSALPVTALLVSPGGALIEPPAAHKPDDPVIDYVWELPAFSDKRDRAALFGLLGRAQDGQNLQIERSYTAPGRTPERRRGLLSLSPIRDEDGLVDLIALTLIDCEDHALPVLGPREPSRMHAAQDRIDGVLDLAQAIIETSYALDGADAPEMRDAQLREAVSARLHRCAGCTDALCQLDETHLSTHDLLEFGLSAEARERIILSNDHDAVPIRFIPALSLLLSELADNAVQHGAWRDATGRVQLALSRMTSAAPEASLRLVWTETETAVDRPAAPGFGLRYAQSVLPELYDAQVALSVEPHGYRWQITLPLGAETTRFEDDFASFDGGYDGDFGAYDRDAERG